MQVAAAFDSDSDSDSNTLDLDLDLEFGDGLRLQDTAACTECCAPVKSGQSTAIFQLCDVAVPVSADGGRGNASASPGCINATITSVIPAIVPTRPGIPGVGTLKMSFVSLPPLASTRARDMIRSRHMAMPEYGPDSSSSGSERGLVSAGVGVLVQLRGHSADYPQCVVFNDNGIPGAGFAVNITLTGSADADVDSHQHAGAGAVPKVVLWSAVAEAVREAEARGDSMLLAARAQ